MNAEQTMMAEKYAGLTKKDAEEEHEKLVTTALEWEGHPDDPISKRQKRWIEAIAQGQEIGSGLNLTGGGKHGLTRTSMPQLDDAKQAKFVSDLQAGKGTAGRWLKKRRKPVKEGGYGRKDLPKKVGVTGGSVPVKNLKATQGDIYGKVVQGMLEGVSGMNSWYKEGPTKFPGWLTNPLMVSKGNYIVDGHHRWASIYARDLIEDNRLGTHNIKVEKINMSITDLLYGTGKKDSIIHRYAGFGLGDESGPKKIVAQKPKLKGKAGGFIPNFSGVKAAMKRESSAQSSKPIAEYSKTLGGIGVYNQNQKSKYGNLDRTIQKDHLDKGQTRSSLSLSGSGRETALRALQARGFKIISIKDTTPMPHNGTRPPKKRRV
jgi:hypothetical protein